MKNPILMCNDEFGFFDDSSPELENKERPTIYNEYDNLNHPTLAKNSFKEATFLKDSTNSKIPKGLKRCFKVTFQPTRT